MTGWHNWSHPPGIHPRLPLPHFDSQMLSKGRGREWGRERDREGGREWGRERDREGGREGVGEGER